MALPLSSDVAPRRPPACRRARVVRERDTLPAAQLQKQAQQDALYAAALCDVVADPESGITAASVVSGGRTLLDTVAETATERGLGAARSTVAAKAPRAVRIFRK